jgi:hypothetical protein
MFHFHRHHVSEEKRINNACRVTTRTDSPFFSVVRFLVLRTPLNAGPSAPYYTKEEHSYQCVGDTARKELWPAVV